MYSFNKCVFNTYSMPDIVLSAEDTVPNVIAKIVYLCHLEELDPSEAFRIASHVTHFRGGHSAQ